MIGSANESEMCSACCCWPSFQGTVPITTGTGTASGKPAPHWNWIQSDIFAKWGVIITKFRHVPRRPCVGMKLWLKPVRQSKMEHFQKTPFLSRPPVNLKRDHFWEGWSHRPFPPPCYLLRLPTQPNRQMSKTGMGERFDWWPTLGSKMWHVTQKRDKQNLCL